MVCLLYHCNVVMIIWHIICHCWMSWCQLNFPCVYKICSMKKRKKKMHQCFCIKSTQEKLCCENRNEESGIAKGGSCLLFDLTVLIPGLITSTISDSAVTMVLTWCLLTAVRGKRERQAQMSFHEVLSLELCRQIPRGVNAQISLQTAVYHWEHTDSWDMRQNRIQDWQNKSF